MTDGTNDFDFASRFQSAKHNPVTPPRQPSSHYNTMSMDSTIGEKPSTPPRAFHFGGDAHRSDSPIDHPNDRPRAHHAREPSTPSDKSYRSGPSAESGRSSS